MNSESLLFMDQEDNFLQKVNNKGKKYFKAFSFFSDQEDTVLNLRSWVFYLNLS